MADKKQTKQCVHWWIIDSNGVGVCRRCHAVKDFRETGRKLDEGKTEKASQGARKSKSRRFNPYGRRGRPPKYA